MCSASSFTYIGKTSAIDMRRVVSRKVTQQVPFQLRLVHIGSVDQGRQSLTAPRFHPNQAPPHSEADVLKGEAAYQEALKVRYEAQREALEMRLRMEKEAVEESNEKKSDKKLTLLNRLASVHRDFKEFGEERRYLEQLVEATVEAKGSQHPMTVAASAKLASCLGNLGEFKAQLALLEGLRDVLPTAFPNPNDATQICVVLHHLASAYENNERIDDQIVTLTRIIDLQDHTLSPTSEPSAVTVNKLAAAYAVAGLHDKQVELLENRIPLIIQGLGATHPHVCIAWMHLALAYGNVGRRDDQLGLYEALEKVSSEAFGSDLHPFVLTVKRNRSMALVAMNRDLSKCVDVLTDVVKNLTEAVGLEDSETQASVHALAFTLAKAGRFKESLDQYDALLSCMTAAGVPPDGEGFVKVKGERRMVAQRALNTAAKPAA